MTAPVVTQAVLQEKLRLIFPHINDPSLDFYGYLQLEGEVGQNYGVAAVAVLYSYTPPTPNYMLLFLGSWSESDKDQARRRLLGYQAAEEIVSKEQEAVRAWKSDASVVLLPNLTRRCETAGLPLAFMTMSRNDQPRAAGLYAAEPLPATLALEWIQEKEQAAIERARRDD